MRRSSTLAVLVSVLVLAALYGAASASAWAPAGSATIHPGGLTFTGAPSFLGGAAQCTANFVFTDASGNVYLGQAAHCSSTGSDTETNGCSTKSLPIGTQIYTGDLVKGGVENGTLVGTLAYNSWVTMQAKGEKDANTCAFNDLALIKVDAAKVATVNPTVPFWEARTAWRQASRPPAARSTPTATRSCAAASACSARRRASASATSKKRAAGASSSTR